MHQNILFSASNLSRNIIRTYARRVVSKKENANPGIQKRVNILEERDESNLENVDVEEFESDFMNLGEAHRQHEKERKYYREKEKFWIVKQKYFKENKVNFLTWNDKEQIRFLHQSNPTEWTIEKLSEGFPALPETIMKVIKSNWQIKNESKRQNHDQAVESNWKLLKGGKLADVLPPNLISHLLNFSSRKQELNLEDPVLTDNIIEKNTKLQNNEFSSIINSYEKIKLRNDLKLKQNKTNEKFKTTNAIEGKLKSYGKKDVTLKMVKDDQIHGQQSKTTQEIEGNLLENKVNENFKTTNAIEDKLKSYGKKNVTLKMVRDDQVHGQQSKTTQEIEGNLLENKVNENFATTNAIEGKLKSYGNKDVTLKVVKDGHIHGEQSKKSQEIEVNLLENLFSKNKSDELPQKFISSENNSAVGLSSDKNKLNVLTYPERIKIPKEKFKKGFTYKVNDCYYDDDGEFLYRVPGMY